MIPIGIDGLRALIDSFLEVGFSKFIVRPLTQPEDWRPELERLATGVADMQT